MFGLGMPEILLILAIALIVIGPQKLPEVAKTLGKAMGEFKRSAQELKNSIDIETTVKEATPAPDNKKLKDVIKDIAEDEPRQPATETGKTSASDTKKDPASPQAQSSDKAEAPVTAETETAPPKV